MEQYNLNQNELSEFQNELDSVSTLAQSLDLRQSTASVRKISNIKDLLSNLRDKTDQGELQYKLFTRKKIAADLNLSFVGEFNDGWAVARFPDGRHNFVDINGNFLYKTGNWGAVSDFKNGFAKVFSVNNRTAFINTLGEEIFSINDAKHISDFSHGFALIQADDRNCFFINKQGQKLFDRDFVTAWDFREGLAAVRDSEKTGLYFIDENGQDICQGKRYDTARSFREGLANVNANNKWYFIKKNGDLFFEQSFEGAHYFSDGLAAVKDGFGWYFIDKNGNNINDDDRFDNINDFKEGLAAVRKDDRWYFIDKTGADICQGQRFEALRDFNEGWAAVRDNLGWYYINNSYTEKIFPDNDPNQRFLTADNFKEGFGLVSMEENKKYLIKQAGVNVFLHNNELSDATLSSSFERGLARFYKKTDSEYMYNYFEVDYRGQIIFDLGTIYSG